MNRVITRYTTAADENALFTKGVTHWRLDVDTTKKLLQVAQDANWLPVPKNKSQAPNVPSRPVGELTKEHKSNVKDAVELALNDPVLFPNLRQMGKLTAVDVELQNGAFDDGWHHDHLSNKRGHAGQFFFIAYLGEKEWQPEWGGGFHYGERSLEDGWAHTITSPEKEDIIWPKFRNALLGWNENPKLIHRAAFLTQPKNRTAFLMPINIQAFS